jgi:hypothetical protein
MGANDVAAPSVRSVYVVHLMKLRYVPERVLNRGRVPVCPGFRATGADSAGITQRWRLSEGGPPPTAERARFPVLSVLEP